MLTSKLIHPNILTALSKCGHGDIILILDGNYPIESRVNPNSEKVYLGLTADFPKVTDVLKLLDSQINFESAKVMLPPENIQEPKVYKEFKDILTFNTLEKIDCLEFYKECESSSNIKLAISTGETRLYSNIMLTVGTA